MVPGKQCKQGCWGDSPRIRGDGPIHRYHKPLPLVFSPYSRGWSAATDQGRGRLRILPVFAGMVPNLPSASKALMHSPRIRGDGPCYPAHIVFLDQFSPYSRGWSVRAASPRNRGAILPVFAGMVPTRRDAVGPADHSPRIRGDGPAADTETPHRVGFSPYSRGWSPCGLTSLRPCVILPVFAGMVPTQWALPRASPHSPRIRGDGPLPGHAASYPCQFSPYSRGWSHFT